MTVSTACKNCGASPCDCEAPIWNYRQRLNGRADCWAWDLSTARPVMQQRLAEREDGSATRGPVQRRTDAPFDFDAELWTVWCQTRPGNAWEQCTSNGREDGSGHKPLTLRAASNLQIGLRSRHPEVSYELRCVDWTKPQTLEMMAPFRAPAFQGPRPPPVLKGVLISARLIGSADELARLLWETDDRVDPFVAEVADARIVNETQTLEDKKRIATVREKVWNNDGGKFRSEAEARARRVFDRLRAESLLNPSRDLDEGDVECARRIIKGLGS